MNTFSKTLRSYLWVFLLPLLFLSCQDDESISPDPGPDPDPNPNPPTAVDPGSGDPVDAEFIVFVADESDAILPGVTVRIGNQSQVSNEEGFAYFDNVTVPSDWAYIQADLAGYHHASRVISPSETAENRAKIRLTALDIAGEVNNQGGTVSNDSGLSVSFPEGAVDGNVQVAMSYLDPTVEGESERMPGSLSAFDEEGNFTGLISYGMAAITLLDENGQETQLNEGTMAEVRMPIPANLVGNPPSTIPLWHFDEEVGIWRQEGEATLQGDEYIGQVGHFSWWNCDDFVQTQRVCLKVNLDYGTQQVPADGLMIEARYPNVSQFANIVLDENGEYCSDYFPANLEGMRIFLYGGGGTRQCLAGSITLNGTEIDEDGNLSLSWQPGWEMLVDVRGEALNCDNEHVSFGFAKLTFGNGNNIQTAIAMIKDGEYDFDQRVLCLPPNGNTGTLELFNLETQQSSQPQEVTITSGPIEMDPITVCEDNSNIDPTQFELVNQIEILPDRKLRYNSTEVIQVDNGYIIVGYGSRTLNEGSTTTNNHYLGILKINLNGEILWEKYHETEPYPINNSSTSFFTRRYIVNDAHVDADGNIVAAGRSYTYRQLNNGNPSNANRKYCPFIMTLDANTGDMIDLDITPLTLMPTDYEEFISHGYNSFVDFDGGRVIETSHGEIFKLNSSGNKEWSIPTYASLNESNDDLKIKNNLIYYVDFDKIKTVDASGNTNTIIEVPSYIRDFDFSNEDGIYLQYRLSFDSQHRLLYYEDNQIISERNITSIEDLVTSENDVIVAHFPFGNGNRMVEKRDRNLDLIYENESFTIPSELNIELLKIAPNQFVKFGSTTSADKWIRMTYFIEVE